MTQLATLDHNCLIALEENRAEASDIKRLISAHESGQLCVRVVAVGASERLPNGQRVSNFDEFRARLDRLGLAHLEILKPLLYYGIGYWEWGVWGGDDTAAALEKQIHEVLFPTVAFSYVDFCSANGIDIQNLQDDALDVKWVNAKCDVLTLWSHIRYGGGIFVTSDANFRKMSKKPRLIALGAGTIGTPADAAALCGF